MYYIERSLDNKNWVKMLDYSMYACRSEQFLVCEPTFAKYLRLIGTHNSNIGDNVKSRKCFVTFLNFNLVLGSSSCIF